MPIDWRTYFAKELELEELAQKGAQQPPHVPARLNASRDDDEVPGWPLTLRERARLLARVIERRLAERRAAEQMRNGGTP